MLFFFKSTYHEFKCQSQYCWYSNNLETEIVRIFENELITRKLIFVIFFRQRIKNYETIRIQIKSQNLILKSSLLLMRMIFQNLLVIEVKKKCFISDKTRFQSHFYLILRLLFQSRIFFKL